MSRIPLNVLDRLIGRLIYCPPEQLPTVQRKLRKLLNDHFNNNTRPDEMRELLAATDVEDVRHFNDYLQEFGSFSTMNFLEELDERVTTLEKGKKIRRVAPSSPTPSEQKKSNTIAIEDKNDPADPMSCTKCGKPSEYRSDTFFIENGSYSHTNYRCNPCKNSFTKVLPERKTKTR